jgi:hypothetical protein
MQHSLGSSNSKRIFGGVMGDGETNVTGRDDLVIRKQRLDGSRSPAARKHARLDDGSKLQRKAPVERELDPHRLEQRQRQLDIGKNTTGYERYLSLVPKEERLRQHPRTPEKSLKCSKRAWDGLVKQWRRKLHEYDISPSKNNEGAAGAEEEMEEAAFFDDAEDLVDDMDGNAAFLASHFRKEQVLSEEDSIPAEELHARSIFDAFEGQDVV